MLDIWDKAGKDFDEEERIKIDNLPISVERISKGNIDFKIFIIELPTPQFLNEAYYTSFVFWTSKKKWIPFIKAKINARYFTMEKGAGRTILGEWSNKGHYNCGEINQSDEQSFLQAIIDKLS